MMLLAGVETPRRGQATRLTPIEVDVKLNHFPLLLLLASNYMFMLEAVGAFHGDA